MNDSPMDLAEATYRRLNEKWKQQRPIVQDKFGIDVKQIGPIKKFLLGLSWLDDLRTSDGRWGAGCFICTEYAVEEGPNKSRSDARAFANFEVNTPSSMQMSNFAYHHNCRARERNVMIYLGLDVDSGAGRYACTFAARLRKGVGPR